LPRIPCPDRSACGDDPGRPPARRGEDGGVRDCRDHGPISRRRNRGSARTRRTDAMQSSAQSRIRRTSALWLQGGTQGGQGGRRAVAAGECGTRDAEGAENQVGGQDDTGEASQDAESERNVSDVQRGSEGPRQACGGSAVKCEPRTWGRWRRDPVLGFVKALE